MFSRHAPAISANEEVQKFIRNAIAYGGLEEFLLALEQENFKVWGSANADRYAYAVISAITRDAKENVDQLGERVSLAKEIFKLLKEKAPAIFRGDPVFIDRAHTLASRQRGAPAFTELNGLYEHLDKLRDEVRNQRGS